MSLSRPLLFAFATLFAASAAAVPVPPLPPFGTTPAEPALTTAMAEVAELEKKGRFDEVDGVLQPWADAANPYVDYARAFARFRLALRETELAPGALDDAVRLAERAAGHGHVPAMHLLYAIHTKGLDRPVNLPAAIKWMDVAASHYDASARATLGVILWTGSDGVPQDRERACLLMNGLLTDTTGSAPTAHYYIGHARLAGDCGLAVDAAQAAVHFQAAADGGVPSALPWLARMALEGKGLPADPAQASSFYRKGLELGNTADDALAARIEAALNRR